MKGSDFHKTASNWLHPIGLALAAILILAVWHFGRIPGDGPLIGPLHSAAHFPLFGLLAIIVFISLRRVASTTRQSPLRAYVGTLLVMLALSGITEWSQQYTERNASLWDVAVNMAGGISALALIALIDTRIKALAAGRLRRVSLAFTPVVLTALVLLPVAMIWTALHKRDGDFPCLVCPENRIDLWMIEKNGASVRLVASPDGERHLEITLETGDFPGVAWEWPVKDWRGFDTLVLELDNPGSLPLSLTLRIDDLHHDYRFNDRFNHRITLEADARSRECIPLTWVENAPEGRQMDLSGIARMLLFGSETAQGSSFRIYSILLTDDQDTSAC